MDRFRSSWLALTGGALLVALSASVALGAPSADADAKRGPSIAGAVHALIFGTNEDEQPLAEECDPLTGPSTCEPAPECDPEVETCDTSEPEGSEEEPGGDADADGDDDGTHGACVREVAQDREAVGGKNDNHGGAVSEAARETCRDGGDEATEADEDGETDDETDHEARGNGHGKPERTGPGKPPWAGNGGRGNYQP